MSDRTRGVTVYGRLIVLFGIYNLVSIGSLKEFAGMFKPLAPALVASIYFFTVFYGVCAVYCGIRILRLADWARKKMLVLVPISVVSGLFLNRIVMDNFRKTLEAGSFQVSLEASISVLRAAVIIMALITVFELSIIYFFTRPSVIAQFRPRTS